jgi:hypothetical protein
MLHRCVCIWQYILQNYTYKLHFQNLSIYHIPHVSMGTLAADNLDVCTACDRWDSNIQVTMGLLLILISKSWGCLPPPGAGHAFPIQWHMRRGGGRLFISARVWCHPWMDDKTDGWKASQKTTTTSFTICNFHCSSIPHVQV